MFGASNTGFGGFGQQNQQQNQQNQPAAGGGLFGNTSGGFGSSFGASSTPAFGAPAQPAAQNTGFGGFGANTSTTPAFGANTSSTPAFGSSSTSGGGLFGSTANTNTANTGFSFGGGGTSAFGSNTNTAAGQSGGLFGAAKPATTGFGGFGQPAQPAQQQPPAGGGLFGGGAATGGFGAANNFSGPANGTASAPYQPTQVLEPPAEEGKPPPASQTPHNFQSITCMPQYKNYSFEELRLQDYQANRKGPSATPGFGGSFGASSTPAFGAPAAPSTGGGLFGSTSTTPAFGSTPAAPSTGFGSAPATGGGLFGSSGGGAFGQPATSQPAASGGLFGSAPSQPATGGLFGSSTTGAGGFGQPAAPASTPSFGGFGAAQNKPATTGFSFGSNNSTTPAAGTGGGLFGSTTTATSQPSNPFGQPAAPATGGGLFGSSQPATSSAPSFSFGASANKPLFGSAAPATSAPAFGASAAATAPKPAFSFGQPATGTTGGGLFGNTNNQQQSAPPAFGSTPAPATGGGLFGGGSTFGQPAQNTGATGLGGGLFGAKPAQPATGGGLFGSTTQSTGGGLFGSMNQAQPQQQNSPFGSTAPSGGLGGSLFGGGASTNQQQGQQQQVAYASSEDPNAYGSNPLFASVGNSPARRVEEKKKPPIFTAFRGTPVNRSSTKITRLRGFGLSSTSSPAATASPLSFGSSVGASSLSAPNGTPVRASPLRLGNGLSDDVVLSPNAFVSRPSVKKLVIDRKTLGKSVNSPSAGTTDGATPGRSKVTFNPEVEVPSRSSLFGASIASRGGGATEDETSFALSEGADGNATFDSPSLNKTAPSSTADWPSRRPTPSTARTPKHGEYFTIPSLETLRNFPAAKLRAVPDLVIGRVGFGQVAFSQPVDLTTLDTMEDLLGGIVRLEDRNATVYPEEYEDIKPSPGEGLNVPATITLENCFPLDKSTRKPIKDGEHPRVQQHIKRLRNLQGTEFVDFEADTGKWTFEVQEF
ncbi:uncharacterized protein JCM6883_001944 [Sporobolomyces salmoneus]|uniref:uncharacterized protein n=1 Tax=Sporobolomyces salmoneus TaxID=183962 RepID=UPI00318176C3